MTSMEMETYGEIMRVHGWSSVGVGVGTVGVVTLLMNGSCLAAELMPIDVLLGVKILHSLARGLEEHTQYGVNSVLLIKIVN